MITKVFGLNIRACGLSLMAYDIWEVRADDQIVPSHLNHMKLCRLLKYDKASASVTDHSDKC